MEQTSPDGQERVAAPAVKRRTRDEDAAFLRAVATLGYFAAWSWMGSSWGSDRPMASLDDVVPLGAGLGVLVGLAHYFDRIYLRMFLTAAAMVAGLVLGLSGPLPD